MSKKEKKPITSTHFQNNAGHYLKKAAKSKSPIWIERHGKPIAVLVGSDKWEEATGKKVPYRSAWGDACRELHRSISKHQKKNNITETISSVELVRQIREENS